MAELPFMATEVILMDCVKAGGDRQELHEKIRVHSMAAAKKVKEEGKPNDLIDRIKEDKAFASIHNKLDLILKPENFIGRASQQVEEFIAQEIEPCFKTHEFNKQKIETLINLLYPMKQAYYETLSANREKTFEDIKDILEALRLNSKIIIFNNFKNKKASFIVKTPFFIYEKTLLIEFSDKSCNYSENNDVIYDYIFHSAVFRV